MASAGNVRLRGNLAVLHGGGPTAVLNASLYGVIREASGHTEVEEILAARYGTQGLIAGDFFDLRREPADVVEALPHTPGSAIGSSRRPVEPGDYERILHHLRARNVRFLLFNGGNGTMLAAGQLARFAVQQKYELRVIGIPKTVDNDLLRTDHCPGYPSAARYLAITAMELSRENESAPFPIQLLETIGRNTGWLAAATALASASGVEDSEGPNLVYVPEIAFNQEQFLHDVEEVYRRLGRVLVVASEGLCNAKGEAVFLTSQESDVDGFGRPLPGNVTVHLAQLIGRELRLRVRNEKPGICARCAMAHVPSRDRQEAQQCGEIAVRHALLGVSGMMVTLERLSDAPYRCDFGLAPLEEVGNRERRMPRNFMNEAGNYPSPAFRNFALPLLDGPLPAYARLRQFHTAAAHPGTP